MNKGAEKYKDLVGNRGLTLESYDCTNLHLVRIRHYHSQSHDFCNGFQ
jgi:hypothetical protein